MLFSMLVVLVDFDLPKFFDFSFPHQLSLAVLECVYGFLQVDLAFFQVFTA